MIASLICALVWAAVVLRICHRWLETRARVAVFALVVVLAFPSSRLHLPKIRGVEHRRLLVAVQPHISSAWSAHCRGRGCNHNPRHVVELGSFARGQQDYGDGGAWRWCWDEVVLLHVFERYERIRISLLCCQLKPF